MIISVALATYNGGRLLEEQLESLLRQQLLPDELVVGDDGSTDETLDILYKFRRNAPFPVNIHLNENNLGYSRNFLATAKRCRGEWISFCDQDDVWLPDKIAYALRATNKYPNARLILQNAWLCDQALKTQRRILPATIEPGFYGPETQYGFWGWLGNPPICNRGDK